MSKDSHTRAYITGFILSLVFTAIPYYLVVTRMVQGNLLIGAALGFALVQMLIQIIFFLHLGRNPKLRWQVGFFVATFGAVLVVVAGSVVIMTHLHRNMMPKDLTDKIANDEAVHEVGGQQVGTCPAGAGVTRLVELKDDVVSPSQTDAKLCDTLIIYNADRAAHDITFGTRERPKPYAGETGSSIRPGQNTAITLTELGSYHFHDAPPGNVSGEFTVTR